MTNVYCADVTCKFNGDDGICTKKKINLSFHSVMTTNNGRQEFHKCKMYQKIQGALEMKMPAQQTLCIYEPLHGEYPTDEQCKYGCEKCLFNVPDISKLEDGDEQNELPY